MKKKERENVGKRKLSQKLSHVAVGTAPIDTGVLTPSWECSGMRTYRMGDVLTQRLRDEWREVLNSRPPDRFSDLLDRLRRAEEASQSVQSKKVRAADGGPYSGRGAKPLDT
jgi:hypothetical protein